MEKGRFWRATFLLHFMQSAHGRHPLIMLLLLKILNPAFDAPKNAHDISLPDGDALLLPVLRLHRQALGLAPGLSFARRWSLVRGLFDGLLLALESPHRSQLAHLDVKPVNVVVGVDGCGC